jgi:hypothetical protein
MEYVVTLDDPTVWTRCWTVREEFTRQNDQENRIYYEPRCIEGNYGLPGFLLGRRIQERAFAEGRGPDPTTMDHIGPRPVAVRHRVGKVPRPCFVGPMRRERHQRLAAYAAHNLSHVGASCGVPSQSRGPCVRNDFMAGRAGFGERGGGRATLQTCLVAAISKSFPKPGGSIR